MFKINKDDFFEIAGTVIIIILVVLSLSVIFSYKLLPSNKEPESIIEEFEEQTDEIESLKIKIDDKVYTEIEFLALDDKPTVVEVAVKLASGVVSVKNSYVSYNTDDSVTNLIYEEEGNFGHLIVPSSYFKGE